jgi:hypothetical protein
VRGESDGFYVVSKPNVRVHTLERLIGVCQVCVFYHFLKQRSKLLEAGHSVARIALVFSVVVVKKLVYVLKSPHSDLPLRMRDSFV